MPIMPTKLHPRMQIAQTHDQRAVRSVGSCRQAAGKLSAKQSKLSKIGNSIVKDLSQRVAASLNPLQRAICGL